MNNSLAPIVLFTYHRPSHTQQVLDSLYANEESKDSILYIYCDGPKNNADSKTLQKLEETRRIVKKENRFKEVIVVEQVENKGLANSIISGVTEVINKYGTVIVLEDDLILSPYFLYYMNDSLQRYEKNNKVGQIGACNTFANGNKFPNSFFVTMPDCLGWATWKDRWNHFSSDAGKLLQEIQEKDLMLKFNAYGSYDMENMLKAQIGTSGTSWSVRWTAVCILNNWLSLYPNPSMSNHLASNEATHANLNITPPMSKVKPHLSTVDVEELSDVIEAMKKTYAGVGDYYGNIKSIQTPSMLKKITSKLFSRLK